MLVLVVASLLGSHSPSVAHYGATAPALAPARYATPEIRLTSWFAVHETNESRPNSKGVQFDFFASQDQDPQDAKKRVDAVRGIIGKVGDFVKGQRETAQYENLIKSTTGRNATNVLDLSAKMKAFGKLGSGLSGMGAALGLGLAVADAFHLFGPTAEEQNAAALKAITGKIENLQETMLGRLDQLEDHLSQKIELESAKTQIRDSARKLSTVQQQMETYRELLGDPAPDANDIDQQERLLAKRDPNDIFEAVNGIYEQVMGDNLATDLMKAQYASTNGDMSAMSETSLILMKMVLGGQAAFETTSILALRRGNEDALRKEIPTALGRIMSPGNMNAGDHNAVTSNSVRMFGPLIDKIADKLREYALKAVRERGTNIKAFMEGRIGGVGNLTRPHINLGLEFTPEGKTAAFKRNAEMYPTPGKTDFEKKYGSLADELKKKFFCDFLVMAYHPPQRVSQGDFTNLVNNHEWAWSGESKYCWFLGDDPDYNAGANRLVFVVVQWTNMPTPLMPEPYMNGTYAFWVQNVLLKQGNYPSTSWLPALTVEEMNRRGVEDETSRPSSGEVYAQIRILHRQMDRFTVVDEAGGSAKEGGIAFEWADYANWKNLVKWSFSRVDASGNVTPDTGVTTLVEDYQSSYQDDKDVDNGMCGALLVSTTCSNRLSWRLGDHKAVVIFR